MWKISAWTLPFLSKSFFTGEGLSQGQIGSHALRTRPMGKATLVQCHGPPARQEHDSLDQHFQDQHVFLFLGAGVPLERICGQEMGSPGVDVWF